MARDRMKKEKRKKLAKDVVDALAKDFKDTAPRATELQYRVFMCNIMVYTADMLLWEFNQKGDLTKEESEAIRKVRVKLTDIPIMRENEFLRNFNEGE